METFSVEECSGDPVRIPESVLRREQARLEELERRRNVKENQSVSEESVSYFSGAFSAEKSAIEELLNACSTAEPEESTRLLEDAALRTQQLQRFLNDSTAFLTQYELRQGQESLQKLQALIAEAKPRKKFAFRSRRVAAESSQPPAVALPGGSERADGPVTTVVDSAIRAAQCGFSNLQNEVLIKRSEEIQQRDVLLSHLTNCKVRLYGSPSTLHIRDVRGCQIVSGPVSSSVFVDECTDCTLVLACQQLRTHNTTDTNVYLHVTSRAIIEDCRGVGFAPFNWTYNGIDSDFRVSGLDPQRNNWSQVDDFNWLAAGTPSPNWTVIRESERISSWDAPELTS